MKQEEFEDHDDDLFEDFGEGFEDEFDAVSEKMYEESFKKEQEEQEEQVEEKINTKENIFHDDEIDENEYEFDAVVGGRDKKPIMSVLNKGKLSKYEMDDLLNQL